VIMLDPCLVPKPLMITNTSSVPLTWHVNGDPAGVAVVPLGSTLAAGEAVSISLTQKPGSIPSRLDIDADIAASQSVQIVGAILGVKIQVPPDIDFGAVPVGVASPIIFIPVPSYENNWVGAGLEFFGGDTSSFEKSGVAPNFQTGGIGWTLYAHGSSPGPVQVTLKFFSMTGSTVCEPSTFTARATIVAQ